MAIPAKVTADDIKVSNEAFKFLVLQKGRLDDKRDDRAAWEAAYREALNHNYAAIAPHLPERRSVRGMPNFLDIGSGLGGIDILISRHYGGEAIPCLLDGVKDKPVMTLHRCTYNDMDVAQRFHADNGSIPITWVDPKMKPLPPLSCPVFLVVSFGSWCFHYAPELYLEYALANSTKRATFIIDVRKDKPEWKRMLDANLRLKAVVHGAIKFDRCVYVTQ